MQKDTGSAKPDPESTEAASTVTHALTKKLVERGVFPAGSASHEPPDGPLPEGSPALRRTPPAGWMGTYTPPAPYRVFRLVEGGVAPAESAKASESKAGE